MKRLLLLLSIATYALFSHANLSSIDTHDIITAPHTRSIGLQFTLINDGTAYEVSRGNATDTHIVIPETYNFLPVTAIAQRGFTSFESLISVSIPSSVEIIKGSAFFNCTGLTSITIPNGVIIIAQQAFDWCSNLASISLPSSVVSIAPDAFTHCENLTSISVDEANPIFRSEANCLLAGSMLMLGCQTSEIPSNITRIEANAFQGCSNLTNITLPSSIQGIGRSAFEDCTSLTSINLTDSIVIIDEYAFNYCSSLINITIPTSVLIMGQNVFSNCGDLVIYTNLVRRPDTWVSIWCYHHPVMWGGITEGLSFALLPNNTYEVSRGTVTDADIEIPAVYNNRPVTAIAEYGFGNLRTVESITIPNNVITIGGNAFSGSYNLKSVTLPNSVTSIEYWAFASCQSLSSITIPNSVTTIGNFAFFYCNSLIIFTELESRPQGWDINWNPDNRPVFWGGESGGLAFTLINDGTEYEVARGTAVEIDIVIPAVYNDLPVTRIAMSGFLGYRGLTSITLPNSITTIEQQAFENCINLTSINLPSSITNIDGRAFYNCIKLASIDLPNGIEVIEWYAFYNCSSLTNIDILSSVTTIGRMAFYGCSGLTTITIPSSVESIGEMAFANCENLASINVEAGNQVFYSEGNCLIQGNTLVSGCYTSEIPEGITAIGDFAFWGCSGLVSVILPASVTTIGYSAFYECSGLLSIDIPNGVDIIRAGAFYRCFNLANVTLPSNITAIERETFYYCQNLANIDLPSGVTAIEANAFDNCWRLSTISISSNVRVIGENAFANCEGLVIFTEHPSQPEGWDAQWNPNNRPVIWGVTAEPVAPSNLEARHINNAVQLVWQPLEGVYHQNFINYAVYRNGGLIADALITNPNYTDVNPPAGVFSYYVTAIYHTGESQPSNTVEVNSESDVVAVSATRLKGNYPNPFNPTTTIAYEIAKAGRVSMEVYNSKGQRVKKLVDGFQSAGGYTVVWNGCDDNGRAVSSGVYFCCMTSSGYSGVKKMVVVK